MKCFSPDALGFLLLRKYVFEESLRMKSGSNDGTRLRNNKTRWWAYVGLWWLVVGSAVFFSYLFTSIEPS